MRANVDKRVYEPEEEIKVDLYIDNSESSTDIEEIELHLEQIVLSGKTKSWKFNLLETSDHPALKGYSENAYSVCKKLKLNQIQYSVTDHDPTTKDNDEVFYKSGTPPISNSSLVRNDYYLNIVCKNENSHQNLPYM